MSTSPTPPTLEETAAEVHARIRGIDPVFDQMMTASIGFARAGSTLNDREHAFLAIVADVCLSNLGLSFDTHVKFALASGASIEDVHELLRNVSYDAGYQSTLTAFERLAEIEEALGLSAPAPAPLDEKLLASGTDAAPSPLPPMAVDRLRELDSHFAEYFRLQSRMRRDTGPGTLSVRDRAFTTMSVDTHYQTLGDTFTIHVTRAFDAGASEADVRSVLRFNAQFGATRAWRAFEVLQRILAERSNAR